MTTSTLLITTITSAYGMSFILGAVGILATIVLMAVITSEAFTL